MESGICLYTAQVNTIKVFHVCMAEISHHMSAEGVRHRSLFRRFISEKWNSFMMHTMCLCSGQPAKQGLWPGPALCGERGGGTQHLPQ